MVQEKVIAEGLQVSEPALTKDPKYERWRWTVFGVTWLTYAGFYLTRKSFSVAKIGMLKDPSLAINKDMLGVIDGAYLLAYAIGQFVWGMLGDRLGARKVVLAGLLVSIVAGFAMGVSSIALLLGVFFFIQGIAQSTGWAPLTKNVGYWFSRKERGRTYGWWCTNYAIGGMIATPFAGYMADRFCSWRYAFFMPAGALISILLLFLILQKNRPEDVGLPPIEEYHGEPASILDASGKQADEQEGSWKAIKEVFKNRMVLLLSAVYFFLKPTRYAILFWGPVIVSEKLGTGMGKSGLISVLFEAAGPIGVLFAGYASDKLLQARRIPICVISLLLLSIILFAFNSLTCTHSTWAICILFFLIGLLLFGPDSLIVGTSAVDFGTKKGASTAAGLINGFGSIGAIMGGSLPGFISERWGWGVLFYILAASVLFAGLLLLPKWNAVPIERKRA
jgi:OPA family sugar phosphate sensor protein UhpC-like MFS transporter